MTDTTDTTDMTEKFENYKAWFKFHSGEFASNALVFATSEEASDYANDLLCRWFAPLGFEVRTTEEPVNYQWVKGVGLEKVK